MLEKYSVLMSVYYKDRPSWLELSLKSILSQTVFPDEIILVKDGKLGDGLEKVIGKYTKEFPKLFNIITLDKNAGLGPALNRGLKECRNNFVIRMDADDYCVPERNETLLKIAETHKECGIIGSWEAEFSGDVDNVVAIHKVPEDAKQIFEFMKRRCALLHPTVLYKKEIIMKCGGYRNAPLYEDYDLFLRVVIEHKVPCYNVQQPLYYIRINDDFFKRRGGLKYMKNLVLFKWKQYENGYMNCSDFCISAGAHAVVCMLPNCLRKKIYMNFLRG